MSKAKPTHQNDAYSIQRGDYGRNYLASGLFIIGRLASGPLQYGLIRAHPLSRFGIARPPTGGTIDVFGHTVPRMPFLTALMPTALSIKHVLWHTLWCRERMTVPFAFFGITADILYEGLTSLVFTAASVNPLFSERQFYIGTGIYFTGMLVELVAELQRVAFKAKAENRGKLCTTGLWSVTRHINYTANVLFGFGVGLATGGPLYTIATAGMYLSNFTYNAMPSIESYCAEKYGQQWTEYKKRTPWQLIPGIY